MDNIVNRDLLMSPWKLALDALDYHKNTFRYFALQNPPDKESSGETMLKNHQRGFTITDKTYFEVQNLINEQAEYLSTLYGKQGKRMTELYDFIINKMKGLYSEAYEKEESLYYSLLPQIAETGLHYADFVKNTSVDNKNEIQNYFKQIRYRDQELSNKSIYYKEMSTIELWTRAANNALERSNLNPNGFTLYFDDITDADLYAFSRIISSIEFYEALKGPVETQIFTRTGALKKRKQLHPEKEEEELADKISFAAIEQLVEDFNKGIEENINDNGNSIFSMGEMKIGFGITGKLNFNYLRNLLSDALADSLSTYYTNIVTTGWGKSKKIDISKAVAIEKKKSTSAVASSKLIRDKLSDIIDKFIEIEFPGNKKEDLEKRRQFGANFSIRISDGSGSNYFVVTSKKYGKTSELYLASREKFLELKEKAPDMSPQEFSKFLSENPDINKELIATVFQIFETTLHEMNNSKLNLLGLGEININDFISKCYITNTTIPYFTSQKDFYNRAALFAGLAKEALEKFFGKGHGIRELWKSFKIANSNAFLSGLFGELSALSDINRIFKRYGFVSGSYGSMLGYGDTAHMAGQSVNDIRNVYQTGEVDKKGRKIGRSVGANIKHYIGSENVLTLYPSKNNDGLSVYSPEMDKYLSKEDSNILRFITSNSGYFDSRNILERIGLSIAGLHLSQFYRAVDFTRGSALNLFYELNNVIYPLTYIYQTVINELEKSKKDINNSLLDVKLVGKKEGKPPMYKDIEEAEKKWKDKDWRISTRTERELDMKIKTKGLKVNLVKLNLFK